MTFVRPQLCRGCAAPNAGSAFAPTGIAAPGKSAGRTGDFPAAGLPRAEKAVGGGSQWSSPRVGARSVEVDTVKRNDVDRAHARLLSRFHALIEHSREGVFVYQEGRYLYVNAVYARMLGYAPEKMIGEQVERFFAPRERRRRAELWNRRCGRREGSSFETKLLHRDGPSEVPVSISVKPIEYLGDAASLGTVRDLSAEWQSQRLAEAARQRMQEVIEYASVGIYRSTPEGRLLSANLPLAKMFGYDSLGDFSRSVENMNDLYVDKRQRRALLRRLDADGSVRNVELRMRHADGSEIWLLENSRMIEDCSPGGICYEGMLLDITERKNFEKRLRYRATHDPLTGLPNRLLMRKRLQAMLTGARRGGERRGAVFFINLQATRKVNDSLGPDQADRLLKQAAKRLFNVVGDQGEVSRHEGQEFVVLAADVGRPSEAERFARHTEMAFDYPFTVDGYEVSVRLLIGIVVCQPDYENPEMVLRDADAAMMECKRQVGSGSGYVFFDDSIRRSVMDRLELETAMREGLERGEFDLYYQPGVDLDTGRLMFFEALLRWHHPRRGLLQPAAFLSIAEKTGLIVELGWRTLRKALEDCAAWQAYCPGTAVAFNLAHQEFYSPRLKSVVETALAQTQLPAHLLHLELTEEVFISEPTHAQRIMERLRALGVCVHLDDFGTGYSSLSYLNQLPIDALKIDRAFVARLLHDECTCVITRNIINLARDLGLAVVAEGVERDEEAALLSELGCKTAQGQYFGMPMSAEAAMDLLKTGAWARRGPEPLADNPAGGRQ